MNQEQEEIQFLGFFGILRESYNIVSSWRKIFAQITAALILPLSFIYLAQIQISELLFTKIIINEHNLEGTPEGTRSYDRISDVLSSELTAVLLFKMGYLVFFLILALLSTSAVVYTIACIYTAKDITFKKVMSVVPKVWKRLIVTYIWNFVILFAYHFVALVVLVLGIVILLPLSILFVPFAIVYFIAYSIGFLYIHMIWQLATVVSVLEESYGLDAMYKSQALIKGKMFVSASVLFTIGLFFVALEVVFKICVVAAGDNQGVGYRLLFGLVFLVLTSIFMLFGLIFQTIIYFVCKSYHHQNIDKSSLSDHLGGYLGEYVPLKSKDVQMEDFEV